MFREQKQLTDWIMYADIVAVCAEKEKSKKQ